MSALARLTRRALPSAAAIPGGMYGAEVGAPFGPAGIAIGGLTGAGLAGYAGELGGQALAREPINPMAATREGGLQALYHLLGIPVTKGISTAAEGLMGAALPITKGAAEQAVATESRLAGHAVNPADVSLARQAIQEGIPAGRGLGGGLKVLQEVEAPAVAKLNQALDQAGTQGQTFTFLDALDDIPALRQQLSKTASMGDVDRAITRVLTRMKGRFTVAPSAPGQFGKPVEFTPQEFNELKRTWQAAAEKVYAAQAKGAVPGTKVALEAEINAALARSARRALETIPDVAEANARLSSLAPLKAVVTAAERPGVRQAVGPAIGSVRLPVMTRGLASRLAILGGQGSRPALLGQALPRAVIEPLRFALWPPAGADTTANP